MRPLARILIPVLALGLCLANAAEAAKKKPVKGKAKPAARAALKPKPAPQAAAPAASAAPVLAKPTGRQPARVIQLIGRAQIQFPGEDWAPLILGQSVPQGSRLRTLEGASLKLRTPDGAETALAGNTEIMVAALSSPQRKRTALQFMRGVLRTVWTGRHPGSSFDVFTPNTVAAVKGTDAEFRGNSERLSVNVYSSEHLGVLVSDWLGRGERLVRPGEGVGMDDGGELTVRRLGEADLERVNRAFGRSFKALSELPEAPAGEPSEPSPEQRAQAVRQLFAQGQGAQVGQAQVSALADKVASGALSQALVERLVEEALLGQAQDASAFLDLAKQERLAPGVTDLLEGLRGQIQGASEGPAAADPAAAQPTPQPQAPSGPAGAGTSGQASPTPAPQASPQAQPSPEAKPSPEPEKAPAGPGPGLDQQVDQELKDLKQDLQFKAEADAAGQRQDLLDGNTFIDRQGYRVQMADVVLRPDSATVQKVHYSKRSEGPDQGQSVFSHKTSFNKALAQDWTVVYKRLLAPNGLNQADNLVGGNPDYWVTFDQVAAASPDAGCLWCYSRTYNAPVDLGASFGQAFMEQYSVQGLDRGQRSYDEFGGGPLAGSDDIQVTATRTGDGAWTFDYYNVTLGVQMFTAKAWLLDKQGLVLDPALFGTGLMGLKGFSDPGLGAFELEVTAPGFLGGHIDVMVRRETMLEAFR